MPLPPPPRTDAVVAVGMDLVPEVYERLNLFAQLISSAHLVFPARMFLSAAHLVCLTYLMEVR